MAKWLDWVETNGTIEGTITYQNMVWNFRVVSVNGEYQFEIKETNHTFHSIKEVKHKLREVYKDLKQCYRQCQSDEQLRGKKISALKDALDELADEEGT